MPWRDIGNVNAITPETFGALMASLEAAWAPPPDPSRAWAAALFDMEERDVDFAEVSDANLEVKKILQQYEAWFLQLREELDDGVAVRHRDMLNDVRTRAHLCNTLLLTQAAIVVHDGDCIPQSMRPATEERDTKKKTAFQRVLLYVLDTLKFYGYRRCGESCFWELKTADNKTTHAYEERCTIAEFVQKVCAEDDASEMWDDFFSCKCSIGDDIVKQLMRSSDGRFPELKPDRYLFSFRNGLYNAAHYEGGVFYPWDEDWGDVAQHWHQLAVRKGLNRHRHYVQPLPPTRADVAIKFFDCDFPVEHLGSKTEDIPTPELDCILDAQGFTQWVEKKWIYGFLGRNIYPIGVKEKWQKVLFILGESGSGKSTICNAQRKVWPAHEVASLGHEDKFQLQSMYDKLHWQCTEVRRDHPKFLIEHTGDAQDMWAGGDVPVAFKGGKQKTVTWTSHGILCGNEVMKARDSRGSVARRLFMVNFEKIIDGSQLDPHLDDKIFANMGHFILKTNRAYSDIACSNADVLDIVLKMPAKFQGYRDDVVDRVDTAFRFFTERSSCNLVHFSDISATARPNDVYMKWTDFISCYTRFLEQNGLPRQATDRDTFKRVMHKNNMKVVDAALPYDNQPSVKGRWIMGIGFRDVWES